MKIEDINIGTIFYGRAGFKYLCTDKGSRTILAILLDQEKEDFWFKGPPYSVEEVVFDETEIPFLFSDMNDMFEKSVNFKTCHPFFDQSDFFKMIEDYNFEYPYQKLLKNNRVDENGLILHPYSAVKRDEQWYIKVFEVFSKEYLEIHEDLFVQMKLSTEIDMQKRKDSMQIK